MSEDSQEKPFEPTQQKLEKSKKEGDLTLSREIITATAFGAIALMLMWSQNLSPKIALWPGYFDKVAVQGALNTADLIAAIWPMLTSALLWAFVVGSLSVIAHLAQGAGPMNAKRIRPKLRKISPLSGAKAKLENLAPTRLLAFLLKLMLITLCYAYLMRNFWQYRPLGAEGLGGALQTTATLMRDIFLIAFATFLPISVVDYLSKWFKRRKKLMMSFQEMKEEQKESSGNPEQKAKRDQLARERAAHNLREGTEKADVIIVNPTHYAIAISWSKVGRNAPICTAKGVDLLAQEIRKIAYQKGIPVYHDPKTARTIYATVPTGEEVPPIYYHYVAVALRFAMRHTPDRPYEK